MTIRLFDVVFSILFLALISPLIMVVGVLIYLEDGAPIIFKQCRVGASGREFTLYKFRSMKLNTPELNSDQLSTISNNASVTRIGALIRRFSIDETPQLINVISGSMSLVGPRPCLPSDKKLIWLRRSNRSLELRPGITGLAQIKAFDGMSVEVKSKYDGIYRKKRSFTFNFFILVSTIRYLKSRPPVY